MKDPVRGVPAPGAAADCHGVAAAGAAGWARATPPPRPPLPSRLGRNSHVAASPCRAPSGPWFPIEYHGETEEETFHRALPRDDSAASVKESGVFWRNVDTSIGEILNGDGAGQTLMLAENIYAGGWASPVYLFEKDEGDTGLSTVERDDRTPDVCFLIGDDALALDEDTPPALDLKSEPPLYGYRINAGLSGGSEGHCPAPNSWHPGGVNVAWADGRAKFLSESVDATAYAYMLTPGGIREGQGPVGHEHQQ